MVSVGHAGGTRGSRIVSSATDVLFMSVVCGMGGVGGVCEMCMCLTWGGVGGERGEWMRALGLGFTNPVGTGGVLDVCLYLGCGGVSREWAWTRVWRGVVMFVCIVSPDSLCRWQVHVSVYCAWWIPAHLRCTHCSIQLHLIMYICFLQCICLWEISQIQTWLSDLDLSLQHPLFMRSSASHPASQHAKQQ